MSRLRQISHLGFPWLFEVAKVRVWQQFMHLLYKHLKDAEELDRFYYDLLDRASIALNKQDAKRALIEASVALIAHEGRLQTNLRCNICEKPINESKIALARGLMPVHTSCAYQEGFKVEKLRRLFETRETILFEDDEIERLWLILENGL